MKDVLLFCGGIGDFLVEESHTDVLPKKVLYYGPHAALALKEICDTLGMEFEHCSPQVFHSKRWIEIKHGRRKFVDVEDGSIGRFFALLRNGTYRYRGSHLLELDLKKPLDETYNVVVPGSCNNTMQRSLKEDEYHWILENTQGKLVILYRGAE
jgi:hypothetical protein